ncbi:MAG: flagellar protein FlaG [Nitrospinota bacterium]|nr:MAG: flagellar protein FlaG [Nitrospinota bacterium]
MDGAISAVNPSGIPPSPEVSPIGKSTEAPRQRAERVPPEEIRSGARRERVGRKDTVEAVDFANTVAEFFDKKISFSYDERIDQVIVKVVEEDTEEVIRQIPPEEIVELVAKLREDFRGLIFNHTG